MFYLLMLGLWIWGIVAACSYDDAAYTTIGRNRTAWIIGVVLFGALGAGIWALVARPQLSNA